MNLVAAQFDRPLRQRARTGIGSECIGSTAPGKMSVDFVSEHIGEEHPINALSGPQGRNCHPLQIASGLSGCLVPDPRHRPVKLIQIAVK